MTGHRNPAPLLIPIAAIALLTGCVAADPAPQPSDPGSESHSATPSPQPTPLTIPDTTSPDQIGSSIRTIEDDVPTTSSITGPAIMLPASVVTVRGECHGDEISWELRTATAGEDQRMLMSGTFDCAAGISAQSLENSPYEGPIQLAIVLAEGVDDAWVQATQAPIA